MRLFDLHCDTLYECYIGNQHLCQNSCQIDLARGLEYDAWGQAFAVWMPDTLRGDAAWEQCRNILEFAHKEADSCGEKMRIITCAEDLDLAVKSHCCASILTVEGGSALAGRLETLDYMKQLDVKMITLTWNGSNELGHGCASGCHDGLTAFGKQVLQRMEELKIVPDVSHLNEQGFWDVMQCTKGPVAASHSVSSQINRHARNLTDKQFEAIRDRGGMVGLTLCAEQLGEQTFDCIERHLYHYLSLKGENMVAFGCDFDGTEIPESWDGIAVMNQLNKSLQHKNYDETLLDRLFFSNCYDFFQRVL